MMQHAVNPWAFARPPPPGFGFPCARQPIVDLSAGFRTPPPGFRNSCARLDAADVPAARVRRPPPPGFSRHPLSPCEIPVPPRFPKRAAPPVSTQNSSTTKRQRVCSDYEDDIDANLRLTERNPEERPRPDYLTTVQKDRVTPEARANLVGWMDAFVRHFDLVDGTLHHAVAYVDRVLSVRSMNTHTDYELRLLGAAAVFAAAKYEDGWRTTEKLDPDKIARYGKFATRKEVLVMERHMVAALGYQLGGPTAHTFIAHFCKRHARGEGDEEQLKKVRRLAHRFADESLRNYACVWYLPSVVAASAILLARFVLNPPEVLPWSREMQELTGYNVMDLAGCYEQFLLIYDAQYC